jgi:hypothetical protein
MLSCVHSIEELHRSKPDHRQAKMHGVIQPLRRADEHQRQFDNHTHSFTPLGSARYLGAEFRQVSASGVSQASEL